MEIKDRIKIIMEKENLAPRVFAENIGIQQSTLSHILNDRNKPSLEVVMKVHQAYNYVNLEWLLYGGRKDYQRSLFDENTINPCGDSLAQENRKEMPLENPKITHKNIVKQEVKYVEKPIRKITEIRIFFDDNTYEIFKPEK